MEHLTIPILTLLRQIGQQTDCDPNGLDRHSCDCQSVAAARHHRHCEFAFGTLAGTMGGGSFVFAPSCSNSNNGASHILSNERMTISPIHVSPGCSLQHQCMGILAKLQHCCWPAKIRTCTARMMNYNAQQHASYMSPRMHVGLHRGARRGGRT